MGLNKSLIFTRAWGAYQAKRRHQVPATFGAELKSCYRIAKAIGYENYQPSGVYELKNS